jgi:hypothetical protein
VSRIASEEDAAVTVLIGQHETLLPPANVQLLLLNQEADNPLK